MSIALIIEIFRQIALNHLIIKDFEVCRPFDYNIKATHKYPMLFFEGDFSMAINITNQSASYPIGFFILTRWLDVDTPISSRFQQLSDMEMIAKTVMLKLNQYKQLQFSDFDAIAVQDVFGDRTIGWRVEGKVASGMGVCLEEGFNPSFNINDVKIC